MYSPKISESLIPRIYRAAKEAKIPMTQWVNRAVEEALCEVPADPPVSPAILDMIIQTHPRSTEFTCGQTDSANRTLSERR